MKNKFYLLVLFNWIALTPFTFGETWSVATNGNDDNAGTLAAPFKTPDRAVEAANPGDIIEFRAGTYPSNELRITKSNLTLRSHDGEWAILEAPLNIEDIASCIWYNEPDVDGGLIENLEIKGGYYYGISFETNWDWGVPNNERHGASNITIRHCKIHHTGRDCLKIKPMCANIQVISCEIYNSGVGPSNDPNDPNAEGIDNVNGSGMVVRNCYFHDTSTTGVYAKGGAKDCLIEENLLINTGESGILLGFYTDAEYFDTDSNPNYYECLNSTARNNIIVNTGGAGIGFFGALNCKAYHNTVITASPKFFAPLFYATAEIWISDNLTLHPANKDISFYNNIVMDLSGNGDEEYTVRVREGALSGSNNIKNNIYQKPSTGQAWFDNGVDWPGFNLADWQSNMNIDQQSLDTDPKLNSQYHLNNDSPAIGAGQAIGNLNDYDGAPRSGGVDIGADDVDAGPALLVPPPAGVIGTGADGFLVGTMVPGEGYSSITTSPNPSPTGIFEITFDKFANPNLCLSVYDALGNMVKKQAVTGANTTIDLHDQPAGIYTVSISDFSGQYLVGSTLLIRN